MKETPERHYLVSEIADEVYPVRGGYTHARKCFDSLIQKGYIQLDEVERVISIQPYNNPK